MSATERPGHLDGRLGEMPVAALAFDPGDLRILAVNDHALDLLGFERHQVVGLGVPELVAMSDRPSVTASLGLLASGAIDRYEAVRHVTPDGGATHPIQVVAELSTVDGVQVGIYQMSIDALGGSHDPGAEPPPIAMAMTNHEWSIDLANAELEQILGRSHEPYIGSSLLALFRPGAAADLLATIDGGARGASATVEVRLRTASGTWRPVLAMIVPLCAHNPPRLFVAFAPVPQAATYDRVGLESILSTVSDCLCGSATRFRMRTPSPRLSPRQWEILDMVSKGERVRDIADTLFLSASTVRNHLATIYRKFGVHSQAELLSRLFNDPSAP